MKGYILTVKKEVSHKPIDWSDIGQTRIVDYKIIGPLLKYTDWKGKSHSITYQRLIKLVEFNNEEQQIDYQTKSSKWKQSIVYFYDIRYNEQENEVSQDKIQQPPQPTRGLKAYFMSNPNFFVEFILPTFKRKIIININRFDRLEETY